MPASTARSTLATVTPALGSDRVTTQRSTSEAQKPGPDNPNIGESSTVAQADGEQTDRQDTSPEDHATISIVNVVPTENSGDAGNPLLKSTVLGEPVTKPNSPNDRSKSHGTNAALNPQTNALSVFLEAQSSTDASMRQQGSVEAPGSEASLASHAMGAASGGAIMIDHSVARLLSSSHVEPAAFATFMAGDDAIAAFRQGSVLVVADGSQILTAQPGSLIVIASHTIGIADDGHALIIGSSTVEIPSETDLKADVSATVQVVDGPRPTAVETTFFQDGQKLTASAAENGIVIQQGMSMVTLAAGQEIALNGHTLSAGQSGPALIVDGSVTNFTPTRFSHESYKKIETTSYSRSAGTAGSAGATDTAEVTTSRSSISQSSTTSENAALASMEDTSMFLRLFCLLGCLWAGVVSV